MSFLIEKAAAVLDLDLRGEIRRRFGAGSGRIRLRRALQRELCRQTGKLFPESLDLLKPPLKFDDLFVSLSHAKTMGGFVLSRGCPIGFDIEELSRFEKHQPGGRGLTGAFPQNSLRRRILCSKGEEAMTDISRLWCLKEAAVKALSARAAEGKNPARAEDGGGGPSGAETVFLRDIAVREAGGGRFRLSLKGEAHGLGAAFQARGCAAAFAKFELSRGAAPAPPPRSRPLL